MPQWRHIVRRPCVHRCALGRGANRHAFRHRNVFGATLFELKNDMSCKAFFRPLEQPGSGDEQRHVLLDGKPALGPSGMSVAAALLVLGKSRFHDTVYDASGRAPWCMMGVCFECLLEIDGMPNVQSCQVAVREGMRIDTQSARVRTAVLGRLIDEPLS